MKNIILFFVIFLVSCSPTQADLEAYQMSPQPEETFEKEISGPVPQNLPNKMVDFNEENFHLQMEEVISVLSVYAPDIAGKLSKCELGYAVSDGYQVTRQKDDDMCLILFVSEEVSKTSEFLGEIAPYSEDKPFVVAMAKQVVGPEYPFIFVGDNTLDLYYLARVMGHEGYHMWGIKTQTDCVETPLCEEINAYTLHFSILEKMYGEEVLNSSTSLLLAGATPANELALINEAFLYKNYKEGTLENALLGMEYPQN